MLFLITKKNKAIKVEKVIKVPEKGENQLEERSRNH